METKTRDRSIAAGVVVLIAGAATAVALLVNGKPPEPPVASVPAEYAALGVPLGRLADALDLETRHVDRITYGREWVHATSPLRGVSRESVGITAERHTDRRGRSWTRVRVSVTRQTGSDYVLTPWEMTKIIPNDHFVLSSDLSRIEVNTSLCDERTGETKLLSVNWTMKEPPRDFAQYGILDERGGDASFAGTFGDEEVKGTEGGATIQFWGGNRPMPKTGPETSTAIDGVRRKPVRCAAR